jgi:hypothetical protein
MATWEDVREIAMGLPEVTEVGADDDQPSWKVKDKTFLGA